MSYFVTGPKLRVLVDEFLQAILDDPENDARRLVYADRLVEAGNPRGELIALQVAMAQGRADPTFSARVTELIDSCWTELSACVGAAGVQRFCVRRGFVDAVEVSRKHLAGLPDLMAATPLLELKLTGPRDGAVALARMRELLRLRVLDLSSLGLGDKRSVDVLRSGFLANVSTLRLSCNGLGEPVARALIRAAPHLPCLEHLHLDMNRLGDDGVAMLVRSPLMGQLVTLVVDKRDVSRDSRAILNRFPCGQPRQSPTHHGVWFPRAALES